MRLQQNSINNKYLIVAAVFIAGITFLLYLPALNNNFVNWDDNVTVYWNTHIREINGAFLKWVFSTEFAWFWHPLTMFSFAIDYAIWGLNPYGYHLTNILIHTINTALVFFLTVRLIGIFKLNPLIAAAVTAFLFGIHPLQVEAVAWITERKGLLYAFFYLSTILLYLKYITVDTKREKLFYILFLITFILALMSKATAVSLPIVLLILDFYPSNRLSIGKGFDRKILIEKLPLFFLTAASSLIAIFVQNKAGALKPIEQYPIDLRILNAISSYITYLAKMLLPINLAPYYPFPFKLTIFHPVFIISLIVFTTITLLGVLTLKGGKPFLFTAWLYYIISLFPVIGIIKVGGFAMADRYCYLPSLGPFILTGIGIGTIFSIFSKKAVQISIIFVSVLLSSVLINKTYRQIGVWKDSITLWSHQIELFPGQVAGVYNNRGRAYYEELGKYQEAMEDFNAAISIDPKFVLAYNNRGEVYASLGKYQEAMEDFNAAIGLNPNPLYIYMYADAYYNRGNIYLSLGKIQEAIEDFNMAIKLDPKYIKAYNNRGNVYVSLGNYQEAVKDFNMVITLDLRHAEAYYNRCDTYINMGNYQEALKDCSMAISLNPKLSLAYYNRGNIYMRLGNHQEAIKNYDMVVTLTPEYVMAYNNRGIAYINLGKPEEAIKDFSIAVKLDPEYTQAYDNLGRLYSSLGNVEQAKINYDRAASLRTKTP